MIVIVYTHIETLVIGPILSLPKDRHKVVVEPDLRLVAERGQLRRPEVADAPLVLRHTKLTSIVHHTRTHIPMYAPRFEHPDIQTIHMYVCQVCVNMCVGASRCRKQDVCQHVCGSIHIYIQKPRCVPACIGVCVCMVPHKKAPQRRETSR